MAEVKELKHVVCKFRFIEVVGRICENFFISFFLKWMK